MSVDIKITVSPLPLFAKSGKGRIPFEAITKKILGGRYELSLVICGDVLAQKMNQTYRKKSYKPNVLSFPLSKQEGEIFLNVRAAAREARTRGLSARAWIAHLFVHGCFHLKGLSHGRIMERQEERMMRAFHFSCRGQYTQG